LYVGDNLPHPICAEEVQTPRPITEDHQVMRPPTGARSAAANGGSVRSEAPTDPRSDHLPHNDLSASNRPSRAVPGENVPGSSVSGSNVPGKTMPDKNTRGKNVPGQNAPGNDVPGSDESSDDLRRKERAENFPVALRVLPARYREHLRNLYDVARVIDDLGDTGAPEQRTAALLAFREDLSTIWRGGTPQSPVLRNLIGTVRACDLPEQPFLDLIEANLRDQTITVYETYEDLLGYCTLSANPVGRLVLQVFQVSTPKRIELSDRVCSALQIIEHCQDVAEDHRAGRLYLPLADLQRFGVRRDDLGAAVATPAVRRLVQFEAERAERLLVEGAVLVGELRGWARLAIAGYIAGGRSAVAALRRADWNVLPTHPRRRRRDVLVALVGLVTRGVGTTDRTAEGSEP
jgi:squalene synthase HpnC